MCCSRDDKTFKPKLGFLQGSSRDRLHEYVVKTLGSGDLRQAVKLPDGENLYEWLAVNSAWRQSNGGGVAAAGYR